MKVFRLLSVGTVEEIIYLRQVDKQVNYVVMWACFVYLRQVDKQVNIFFLSFLYFLLAIVEALLLCRIWKIRRSPANRWIDCLIKEKFMDSIRCSVKFDFSRLR